KTVDQRGRKIGAGSGVDAPARNEAALERFEEQRFPFAGFGFRGGKRACHAPSHILDAALVALGILLQQDVDTDLLWGQNQIGVVGFHNEFSRYSREIILAISSRRGRKTSRKQLFPSHFSVPSVTS